MRGHRMAIGRRIPGGCWLGAGHGGSACAEGRAQRHVGPPSDTRLHTASSLLPRSLAAGGRVDGPARPGGAGGSAGGAGDGAGWWWGRAAGWRICKCAAHGTVPDSGEALAAAMQLPDNAPPCPPPLAPGGRLRRGVPHRGAGGGAGDGRARHRRGRGAVCGEAGRVGWSECCCAGAHAAWFAQRGGFQWQHRHHAEGLAGCMAYTQALRPPGVNCTAGQAEPLPVHQLAVPRADGRLQAQAAAAAQGGEALQANCCRLACHDAAAAAASLQHTCPLACCVQDRVPGPAFEPRGEGDQDLERMMGEMQAGRCCGFAAVLPCIPANRIVQGAAMTAAASRAEAPAARATSACWHACLLRCPAPLLACPLPTPACPHPTPSLPLPLPGRTRACAAACTAGRS